MSKIISMTPEMSEKCREEFALSLKNTRCFNGVVNLTKVLGVENARATVIYSPLAWAKTTTLLSHFNKEVAWHGVVERIDGDDAVYLISDIVVYPQEVTPTSVEMDERAYAQWLMENYEDERFNHLRMQGHSHVNMETSPSGVDLTHQAEILSQLGKEDFYIFMIYNKRQDKTIRIYDLKRNILFENADITVQVEGVGYFLQEVQPLVVDRSRRIVSKQNQPSYIGSYGGTYDY